MAISVLFTKEQHTKIKELSRPKIRGGSSGSDPSSDSTGTDNLNHSKGEARIVSGRDADSEKSVITEKIKRLARHQNKISLRRANTLRSASNQSRNLVETGVNRVANLTMMELGGDNAIEPL